MPDLLDRLKTALADRYAIERELGAGGMATVYLAEDLKHHRKVAIKVLRPELAAALGAVRFLREIEFAANLAHPHILPLHDSGEADGFLYYVMPFVEGGSLRGWLNRDKQLPLDGALKIAREVADALSYAHANGVIHRDIKPENILIDAGHAVVADFGIARAVSAAETTRLTGTGLPIGTPMYMSPEQCGADERIDGRSDVYAVGCVLYEMLVGEPPFTGPTAAAIIARHMHEAPRSLRIVRPTVSIELEQVVEKALAKIPADRFESAGRFAEAVALSASLGSTSRRTPAQRWGLPAAAAAVVGVLVVLTFSQIIPPRGGGTAIPGIGVVVLPFDTGDRIDVSTEGTAHRLFSDALGSLPAFRPIDGGQLLDNGTNWSSMALEDLLNAARRLGGQYVVAGRLLGTDETRTATADVYVAETGEHIGQVREAGSHPLLEDLIDRLVLRSVRELVATQHVDIGVYSDVLNATSSAVALGHLLRGRHLFWSGDEDAAVAALEQAIAVDSTFGPAYHRLSVAEGWRWNEQKELAVADAGLANLNPSLLRWRDLLEAQRRYAVGNADSAINAFRMVTLDHPDNADGFLGLGEALVHYGAFAGYCTTDAVPAFERMLSLDSGLAPIGYHMIDAALQQQDSAGAARLLSETRVSDSQRAVRAAAFTLQFGTDADRAATLSSLRDAGRQTISALIVHFAFAMSNPALADTLASLLQGSGRTTDDRLRGVRYRLVTGAALGRWDEALTAWEPLGAREEFDRWVIQASLAGFPAGEHAKRMYDHARRLVGQGSTPNFTTSRIGPDRQAFRALVHRATLDGDSSAVLDLLRALDTAAESVHPADPVPPSLRKSLRARLALLAGDTTRAIARLEESLARRAIHVEYYYPLLSMAPQRMMLANLFAARGDDERSARWLESFHNTWSLGDVFYHRRVAELEDKLGVSHDRGPSCARR